MPTVTERAHEVADELAGTCNMLEQAATPEEIQSTEFCQELDSLVFECDICGWWCRDEEMAESTDGTAQICFECSDGG